VLNDFTSVMFLHISHAYQWNTFFNISSIVLLYLLFPVNTKMHVKYQWVELSTEVTDI